MRACEADGSGATWVVPTSEKMNSSKKGFYAMSYLLSLFAAVAVQKNVRDVALMSDAWQEPVSGPGGAA